MNLNINAIELHVGIPEWIISEQSRCANLDVDDDDILVLSNYVLHGWPSIRA